MAVLSGANPTPAATFGQDRAGGQASAATTWPTRTALILVLAGLLALQPLSAQLARTSMSKIQGGYDPYSQWQAYLARPAAPEVLFVGDSETRTDIDLDAVAAQLSASAGRRVTVGKLGIPGEVPSFQAGLVYRVMHRPSRPRIIVFGVSPHIFNDGYQHPSSSFDLWQISAPWDPGYLREAYELAPDRGRFTRDLLVPYFAAYVPTTAALGCWVVQSNRADLERRHQPVPAAVQAPTSCELGRHPDPGDVMTAEDIRLGPMFYRQVFIDNYRFSDREAQALSELVDVARRGSAQVLLYQYPTYGLDSLDPAVASEFSVRIHQLSRELGTPMVDLREAVALPQPDWADPLHLNRAGATALAPAVAAAVTTDLR